MRVQAVTLSDGRRRYLVLDHTGTPIAPVARYLRFLDQAGRARNTLRGYAHSLRLYFEYLHIAGLDHTNISLDDMARFVHWLKVPATPFAVPSEPARTATTINHTLTVVSGFYDYLWRSGATHADLKEWTHRAFPAAARRGGYKSFLHGIARAGPVEGSVLKQKTIDLVGSAYPFISRVRVVLQRMPCRSWWRTGPAQRAGLPHLLDFYGYSVLETPGPVVEFGGSLRYVVHLIL